MQHFSHHGRRARLTAQQTPKKTPDTMPASEHSLKKDKPIFEENAALPDSGGRSGVRGSQRSDLLMSMQFGCLPSFVRRLFFAFPID
jgi:hypothetical protein